jgi:hypothetical protein
MPAPKSLTGAFSSNKRGVILNSTAINQTTTMTNATTNTSHAETTVPVRRNQRRNQESENLLNNRMSTIGIKTTATVTISASRRNIVDQIDNDNDEDEENHHVIDENMNDSFNRHMNLNSNGNTDRNGGVIGGIGLVSHSSGRFTRSSKITTLTNNSIDAGRLSLVQNGDGADFKAISTVNHGNKRSRSPLVPTLNSNTINTEQQTTIKNNLLASARNDTSMDSNTASTKSSISIGHIAKNSKTKAAGGGGGAAVPDPLLTISDIMPSEQQQQQIENLPKRKRITGPEEEPNSTLSDKTKDTPTTPCATAVASASSG